MQIAKVHTQETANDLDYRVKDIELAEGRLGNLGCTMGHPSFVMSASFPNQTLAQMDLWQHPGAIGGRRLSKELDEEVARLHVENLGGTHTRLNDKQSAYINTSQTRPFKDHYHY